GEGSIEIAQSSKTRGNTYDAESNIDGMVNVLSVLRSLRNF
ncbi:hypothetical protein M076_5046, partial [Bacteroides fragilis str. 2-F-2 